MMQGPPPGPEPCTQLRLYFRGSHLADTDTFSKSDPYCVIYHTAAGSRPVEVGRTEVIWNDLNPVWQRSIQVPFYFEQKQEFSVQVYDEDEKGDAKNDRLGSATFLLSQIVSSRKHTAEFPMQPRGKLYITAEEIGVNGKDKLCLNFQGRHLKKMDMFGLSDPYFKLSRILPNGTKKLLWKSKTIKNTLDPNWDPCPDLRLQDVTNVSLEAKCLEFECWDEDFFSDDYMGCFLASVQDLTDSTQNHTQFTLRKKEKPGKQYGEILVNARFLHFPTFADFLQGGLQINLAVSIDFTGSNGDPRDPRSLHFMNPGSPNHYVRAIMSVGEILMAYDTDKMAPVFGFGARLPSGKISHFFHVNLTDNPYVHDVQGILDGYSRCLSSVALAGPTNFAPTITAITEGARKSPGVYTILLILTDGEITDMDNTIDAIVAADDAPLSVVIVGVGYDCDFQNMDILDGDDVNLCSSGNIISRRDLVQFVPFRDFERAPPGALAAAVLHEVPDQVTRWAEINKVTANVAQSPEATATTTTTKPPNV